jgi:hypothetical protein
MRLANLKRSGIVLSISARWKNDKPMSRPAFDARFSNEEGCPHHLAEHSWPEGFICPSYGT